MVVIRTRTHAAHLTGEEITAFLLNPTDNEYQRWWNGTHLELHHVKRSGKRVGDVVYMDELIGRRRIRMTGVVVECIPGKKITWQLRKLIRLPVWLSLELEDDDRGVTIAHSVRAGFDGLGRILDPLLRLYFTDQFARALDDHVKTEFPRLENMLHRRFTYREGSWPSRTAGPSASNAVAGTRKL